LYILFVTFLDVMNILYLFILINIYFKYDLSIDMIFITIYYNF